VHQFRSTMLMNNLAFKALMLMVPILVDWAGPPVLISWRDAAPPPPAVPACATLRYQLCLAR